MIDIVIIPGVRISRADRFNWSIEALRKGEWKRYGYYGTVADAARSLIERHVQLLIENPESVTDVRSLILAIERATQRVERAIAPPGRRKIASAAKKESALIAPSVTTKEPDDVS